MASPWHRPDAASGVSDLDRLRRLVDTDTLPAAEELDALFPDRAHRDIMRRVKYLRNPEHPLTPLSFRLSDRHPTPRMPQSNKPVLNAAIHLPGPSCLCLSDLHVPFHFGAFIQECVELAVAWGIPHVILNGDVLDIESFSRFDSDPNATLEEELFQGEQTLAYLAANFERVIYTTGNHENRLLGATMKRELKAERFLRMFTSAPNVEISVYAWSTMDSPTGLWRFVHPQNASLIAGRVPTIIASRRFTDSHVVGAHGHLWSIGRTEDGKRWAIDSGCCLDTTRIGYSVMNANTRPVMVNGAVIVYEGRPHLLSPQTDWDAMKRMYPAA